MARAFESANSEYLTYGSTSIITGTDVINVSLGIWFYLNTAQNQHLISIHDADGTERMSITQAGAGGSFVLRGSLESATGSQNVSTPSAPSTGAWHSAVATFTGATNTITEMRIYLDGVVAAVTGLTKSAPDLIDQARIASGPASDPALANAALWRACMWDSVLSQADVDAFHAGTSPASIAGGPVQWCEIEGASSPEPDEVAASTWTMTGTASQVDGPFDGGATEYTAVAAGAGATTADLYRYTSVSAVGNAEGIAAVQVAMQVQKPLVASVAGIGAASATFGSSATTYENVATAAGTGATTVSMGVARGVAAAADGAGAASVSVSAVTSEGATSAGSATASVSMAVVRTLSVAADGLGAAGATDSAVYAVGATSAGLGAVTMDLAVVLGTTPVVGKYAAQHARAYALVKRMGG